MLTTAAPYDEQERDELLGLVLDEAKVVGQSSCALWLLATARWTCLPRLSRSRSSIMALGKVRIFIPFGPLCNLVHRGWVMDEDPVLRCVFEPSNLAVQSLRITDVATLKQPGPKCCCVIYDRPCLLALMESVSSPVLVVYGLESLPHG